MNRHTNTGLLPIPNTRNHTRRLHNENSVLFMFHVGYFVPTLDGDKFSLINNQNPFHSSDKISCCEDDDEINYRN